MNDAHEHPTNGCPPEPDRREAWDRVDDLERERDRFYEQTLHLWELVGFLHETIRVMDEYPRESREKHRLMADAEVGRVKALIFGDSRRAEEPA